MDSSSDEEHLEPTRQYNDRINFYLAPVPFKERYRFTPTNARLLVEKLAPHYRYRGSRKVDLTVDQKILIGLQCLASSAFYYVISDTHGKIYYCQVDESILFYLNRHW